MTTLRPRLLLLAALAVPALAGSAGAACMDDATALSVRLEPAVPDARLTSDGTPEAPGSAEPVGLALTGDPVNPYPPEPTTAEAPMATPTAEEATGVMPGADPSVELVGEETRGEVAARLEEATAAAEAGDEEACLAALEEARALMPSASE